MKIDFLEIIGDFVSKGDKKQTEFLKRKDIFNSKSEDKYKKRTY